MVTSWVDKCVGVRDIQTDSHTVRYDGKYIDLTPTSYSNDPTATQAQRACTYQN